MPGALEGVRIVDVTSGMAGAMATMLLSDHGADVIKVERPGGDPLRAYGGSVVWNRGKRSVELDLADAESRARLLELASTADVLVESHAPGRMAGWGLDYDRIHPALPGLVYCSVTGYGRNTAAAARPAIDLLVQARSGQQFEQPGWREGPIFLYAPLPSLATSYLIVEGVLAALYAREVTGTGQWVETSLYQGVLAFTTQLWQDVEHRPEPWFSIGRDPQPSIYECADGSWVHSMHQGGGRGKDRSVMWRILGMDPPAPARDAEDLASQQLELRAAFKKIERDDLLAQFWANEIPIAPVRQAHEAFEDPQLINNGMVVEVVDPVHGRTTQAGITFRLHGAPPAEVQGPQPAVGQHTEEVLAGLADEPARARGTRPARRPLAHALDGIKVLDLGNFLAGPFGPMVLGDLGATVYKLESPEGDQMRPITEPFNGCQRGKLDICVDLKTEAGLEIAHRLIREVDVVHHNMRPGVAERLGVDYATAERLNPTIVYCHTTMWGIDGPRATWPGFDQLGQSSCGLEYELGGEGNPPVWYRFGMCDQACAFQSALAVLMALYWREKTGRGQFLDTSIVNGGLYLNSDVWIGPDGPLQRPRLDQDQTGVGPLYRLYRTADAWLAIACLDDAHWLALTHAVPGLDDPRFATTSARADNAPALSSALEEAFGRGTAAEWFERLDAAGVPAEIADEQAPKTWFDQPDLVAAGLVADYRHPDYGRFRQFGHLVHLSETPGRITSPPPRLGEHSRQVLAQLGYSEQEMEDLRAAGVTTWPAS
jgi:crotonobetainyl-CoA:carnitine CoA-transferase CaiB-like acyl-CoA transferase